MTAVDIEGLNLLDRRYATVVIDPPWDIGLTGYRANGFAPELRYATMTVPEVRRLNIPVVPQFGARAIRRS